MREQLVQSRDAVACRGYEPANLRLQGTETATKLPFTYVKTETPLITSIQSPKNTINALLQKYQLSLIHSILSNPDNLSGELIIFLSIFCKYFYR